MSSNKLQSVFKVGDVVKLSRLGVEHFSKEGWKAYTLPRAVYEGKKATVYDIDDFGGQGIRIHVEVEGEGSTFFFAEMVELVEDDSIIYKGWKLPKRYADKNATEIEKAMFESFKKSADKHHGPHTEKESDAVHSPKHYAVFDDIEAIEVIARSMTQEMFKGYCFGNLLKYRLRVGSKDEVMQELGKADKYKELYEKFKGLCQ